MAEITSLGIHTPVAFTKGVLPPEAQTEPYQWDVYVSNDGHGELEEEILATKTCVVWSQGNFIRQVYRFELEGEEVVQAILTTFPSMAAKPKQGPKPSPGSRSLSDRPESLPPQNGETESLEKTFSRRALVVCLKTKAHIYFLHGATHIVDVPLEVAKASPCPQGVLLQRKASPLASLPPTPQVPAAPPNSFLSTQPQPSSSYLLSPTLKKSFHSSQKTMALPNGRNHIEQLLQDVTGSTSPDAEDDAPSLYVLTNPFSEMGVVAVSREQVRPPLGTQRQASYGVEFETLDPGEEVVYMSASDELLDEYETTRSPLTVLVTINNTMQTLNIWQGWYPEERPLSSLLRERAAAKAAAARRRSSFPSNPGATAPTVRSRDAMRESLVGGAGLRVPSDAVPAQHPNVLSRKATQQDAEDAMASQMDLNYLPGASQQSLRESRRISSLNADVRQSHHNPGTSFTAAQGRRNPSFGGHNDRRSFGHRKSRGSTPGSVLTRSIGAGDDFMDLDATLDLDDDLSVESIMRHIRATFDATGAESLFAGANDEMKRELIVRKLHSMPLTHVATSSGLLVDDIQIAILHDPSWIRKTKDHRLNIYIHQKNNKDLTILRLLVKERPLWPGIQDSVRFPVPLVVDELKTEQCHRISKLSDDSGHGILLAGHGVMLSVYDESPWPLPKRAPYRARNNPDARPTRMSAGNSDMGRSRILDPPSQDDLQLLRPGVNGCFDETTSEGVSHRRKYKLRPAEKKVDDVLKVFQLVLSGTHAPYVRGIWCLAHAELVRRPELMARTACSRDWVALLSTVFLVLIDRVDKKARATLQLSLVAAGKDSRPHNIRTIRGQHEYAHHNRGAFEWLLTEHGSSVGTNGQTSTSSGSKAVQQDRLLIVAAALACELADTEYLSNRHLQLLDDDAVKLLLALHIFREEQKLNKLSSSEPFNAILAATIAQIGALLGLDLWSYGAGQYYELEGASKNVWAFVRSTPTRSLIMPLMDEPVGVFHWFEHAINVSSGERYPTLDIVATLGSAAGIPLEAHQVAFGLTKRIAALSDILESTSGLKMPPPAVVEAMARSKVTKDVLETLPEALVAPFRDAMIKCEKAPPTKWSSDLLSLIGREDLAFDSKDPMGQSAWHSKAKTAPSHDVQGICQLLEQPSLNAKTKEASRHVVSQLIFHEDRRLVEAANMMHYHSAQVAECPKQSDWTDAQHLEQQRKVMQWVTTRMIALPAGDAMIHFDCQRPLLTEKYHLSGFSNSCLMQPMGHTLTTDRAGLTEEKVNWAYFHAGASAGLRISRNITGIDTSWIAFNKPADLTNRHAGLLLALGLNGHLKNVAKWLSFKYLTPKHNMTSIGLLLGLSASYLGTMDGLITRMLSVHITRMLPPGAAELNVSPLTQTAGLIGIGLLYCNTQHRRMSEVMLSEVEHMELEDPDSGPDPLRDECYRLAAGFALGYINLGKGNNLQGLHGMYLPERLLAVAVGPRPVNAVHVFDRATAGAVVALALVYMKTGNVSIAHKVDIPDTQAQFDHVRPDVLMLRAMAKHLILWDDVQVRDTASGGSGFIERNLPGCYQGRIEHQSSSQDRAKLDSSDVPFFNIVTGLAWALSLKYAGSGSTSARDEVLGVLDMLERIKSGAEAYYYDAKLARATVRRCIDVLALAAATIMAGTGDLKVFRYLRRLHGHTDAETTYGSHLAAHLAIGALFIGGGTYTFGTSNLAIASLMCAFYPLFPTDVQDNRVHLQALRHFWVFAAEARCLIIEEFETRRPIRVPVDVTMKDGSVNSFTAPCLLPELDTISSVRTTDPTYWPVTLDFANNPQHLAAFRKDQRVYVRQCPASEAHESTFASTLAALNITHNVTQPSEKRPQWQSVLSDLSGFRNLDKGEIELVLPQSAAKASQTDDQSTIIDDSLALNESVASSDRDSLWNLRVLFAWADKAREHGDVGLQWLGNEAVEELRATIDEKIRRS